MLFLIWACGQGLTGTATDSATDQPLPAVIRITTLGWIFYSDPKIGDFHRFLMPGTYDVEIRANGYETKTLKDIEVVYAEQTDISVELIRAESPEQYGYKLLYNTLRLEEEAASVTVDALGPPDGVWYSIGKGGFAVIDMGPSSEVSDGPGDEVTVFGNEALDEGFELFASLGAFGPWASLGVCSGTCSLDLKDGDLESARYFKIVDDDIEEQDEYSTDPGYDLDAISVAISSTDSDSDADVDTDAIPDAGSDTDPDTTGDSQDSSCGCRIMGSDQATGMFIVSLLFFLNQ
jgi:hypothetical protein